MKKWFILLALMFFAQKSFCQMYNEEKLQYKDYLKKGILYVLITFDGSYKIDKWKTIIKLSKEEKINTTVFVSAVNFLNNDEKHQYMCPFNSEMSGLSEIGFGSTKKSTDKRIDLVKKAQKAGISIQSHLVGHFDGSKWPQEVWDSEFKQYFEFTDFLKPKSQHVCFPYLEYNTNVYYVLEKYKIKSILSTYLDKKDIISTHLNEKDIFKKISITNKKRDPYFFYEFPIPVVNYGNSNVILMDYNFFIRQKELSDREIEEKMEELYLNEAKYCFENNTPLFISHHFYLGREVYWKVLKNTIFKLRKIYKDKIEFITIDELCDMISSSLEPKVSI